VVLQYIIILLTYGTTVGYAIRLWPKRRYAAHTCRLKPLKDTWHHEITEHRRYLLSTNFGRCNTDWSVGTPHCYVFIADALWYICNYRRLLHNERIRTV